MVLMVVKIALLTLLLFLVQSKPTKLDGKGIDVVDDADFSGLALSAVWSSMFDGGEMGIAEVRNNGVDANCEVSLYRAVIMQALLDTVSNSTRTEDKLWKKDSICWFHKDNKDFIKVFEYANLNKEWVLQKSNIAIKNSCKRRAEAGWR